MIEPNWYDIASFDFKIVIFTFSTCKKRVIPCINAHIIVIIVLVRSVSEFNCGHSNHEVSVPTCINNLDFVALSICELLICKGRLVFVGPFQYSDYSIFDGCCAVLRNVNCGNVLRRRVYLRNVFRLWQFSFFFFKAGNDSIQLLNERVHYSTPLVDSIVNWLPIFEKIAGLDCCSKMSHIVTCNGICRFSF